MGDPNIHKLLQKHLSASALDAEIEQIFQERLRRLQPLLDAIEFDNLIRRVTSLRWLDLGTNDGSILGALKRRYPSLEAFGVEHRAEEYRSTYAFLQAYAPFTMKSGSWHDDIYPPASFDIVASIHAWPLPPNYLARMEEIRRIQDTGKEFQQVLFDKAFSLKELERFLWFVKPGGYLLLKTWETPLVSVPRKVPFLASPQPSYNLTRAELGEIGDVVYFQNIYLVLQKRLS